MDPRITKLIELITSHSLSLSSQDQLLIHAFDMPENIVAELARIAQKSGSHIHVKLESTLVQRQLMMECTPEQLRVEVENQLHEMNNMTAYIALRAKHNIYEHSDIPPEKMQQWQSAYREVLSHRVDKTKWVILRWPNSSMAQQAGLSTQAFEDFYFNVCTVDYRRMAEVCKPLEALMDRTDQVHITAPGTDLKFSIKGIKAQPCTGERNIPDGECFSCPLIHSMNGVIQYNTSTLYMGTPFKNIRFVVKDGKIIEATAESNTDKLNQILDTDPGARYFGEWSLGFNPQILHPMNDTLFDEKIAGSFHLTPGKAYLDADNGNRSAIHWDIVHIQRPEYGGGEIFFDGQLIRKDGIFVHPDLVALNPDQLSGSF